MRHHRQRHSRHQQEAAQTNLRAASGLQGPHQAEHQREAEVQAEVDAEDI